MGVIKAYPVIYTRTKKADFVYDFLARPSDFDHKKASKFVLSALRNLDFYNGIRHAIFSVGDYFVCGGIATITANLAKLINKNIDDDEYLKDEKGRRIIAFTGFAVKKSDWVNNELPYITLEQVWNIYLVYLKQQWENSITKSVSSEPIELETKPCIYKNIQVEQLQGKTIVNQKHFDADAQNYLDYFGALIKGGTIKSFITGIENESAYTNSCYQAMAVSNSIIEKIKGGKISVNDKELSKSYKQSKLFLNDDNHSAFTAKRLPIPKKATNVTDATKIIDAIISQLEPLETQNGYCYNASWETAINDTIDITSTIPYINYIKKLDRIVFTKDENIMIIMKK